MTRRCETTALGTAFGWNGHNGREAGVFDSLGASMVSVSDMVSSMSVELPNASSEGANLPRGGALGRVAKLQGWHTNMAIPGPLPAHRYPIGGWVRDGCRWSLGARYRGERPRLDGLRWLRSGFRRDHCGSLRQGCSPRGRSSGPMGGGPLLAAAGVLLSVIAVAVLVVVAVFWLLVNFPSLVTGKQRGLRPLNHTDRMPTYESTVQRA